MILRIHNCFHIWYIATAYLYGIFVECFVELVVRWKMFISFFQLCNNICTVWLIEPYYYPFPVFGGGGILSCFFYMAFRVYTLLSCMV